MIAQTLPTKRGKQGAVKVLTQHLLSWVPYGFFSGCVSTAVSSIQVLVAWCGKKGCREVGSERPKCTTGVTSDLRHICATEASEKGALLQMLLLPLLTHAYSRVFVDAGLQSGA